MRGSSYPNTVDNGAGERITFLGREPNGSGGERLRLENRVSAGQGPPMHAHLHQAESLTVLAGRIGYRAEGEAERFAGPGETVVFPAGTAHCFWSASEETLHCAGWIDPADNAEFFLSRLFESTRLSGRGRPNLFDTAFLLDRYASEYRLAGVPWVARALLFPLIRRIGLMTGRYAKFRDAPEPRR